MVKVREEQPLHFDGSINIELWLQQLHKKSPGFNIERIRGACDLSEKAEEKAVQTHTIWAEGRSSYKTGLDMADILSELRMDEEGIVAAIIYRAVRENQITLNHVRKQFGETVATLVEGVLRMAAISNIRISEQSVLGEHKDQLEQAKRLLIALVDDVRVALIKLAERTCAIREVARAEPEKRIRLAREVMEIYAPLAHRLGIGHLKWELEDLSFRYVEPLAYKRIAGLLDEKRSDRQGYIDRVIATLNDKLKMIKVKAELDGRAKHIYSIWRKMRSKGITFSQVYDVRAVRILVPKDNDCYRVLGVVHNLWRNLPHEFDDYIASPKENGYRSLHTAVIGPENKVLEVQIRTYEMHEKAELGVCSHWQYKSHGQADEPVAYRERIEWLRQILDWREELGDVAGISKELLDEISLDRIYVFTPEGHVVDLTPNATPVDFAYRVHTEVGHKCRGAKINGKVVPLNTRLKSGDQIEIIVGNDVEPRREWLHAHLGYVTTSRARAKIQSWFGLRTKRKNTDEGKQLLTTELQHLGVEHVDIEALVAELNYKKVNEMYAAIGAGDINVIDVVEAAVHLVELETKDKQLSLLLGDEETTEQAELLISGLGGLHYSLSVCCGPMAGDSIVGIINDDSCVEVHCQDCLQALQADSYGRLMRLDWRAEVTATFPVTIEVSAYDRRGLLHDITGVFMAEETNVIAMNSQTDKINNRVTMSIIIEVSTINRLLRTIEQIEQLSNVIAARRKVNH
ncbi:MAG: bifunctional (p)ppGpp synthetase/guanosine-3',5'-bis(diphosphate) 3'-pyrophosphohydrolase [Pseudomonadales bacterium]|nr:bifunctional (p)ppGpp synthetase/guanosine-3',5'-bis(diphosphate) 3'-pyrophosphohydrolase [Pseudomonadales bacterium]MDP4640358.1 bifunctional (p)ppGpp synthetase/guanosine-3',5'-bis(diphosphate) 3'-pyrophosphohydrolase [Pseudomonadales bacterium]MDP4765485.1 bifunctional (p)ppGpp synthetase/guanosine-3',5'-bis(diphosphate) 3'-pyrophosphohydrolase [Pseudomonadales bacterium]MDP4875544.1 bifunctional (p)ppGpp synthetase/guanosine-3',5'-bis(diphosphate) 3'-pyrophosphohydrolase [Pseudomonadales 